MLIVSKFHKEILEKALSAYDQKGIVAFLTSIIRDLREKPENVNAEAVTLNLEEIRIQILKKIYAEKNIQIEDKQAAPSDFVTLEPILKRFNDRLDACFENLSTKGHLIARGDSRYSCSKNANLDQFSARLSKSDSAKNKRDENPKKLSPAKKAKMIVDLTQNEKPVTLTSFATVNESDILSHFFENAQKLENTQLIDLYPKVIKEINRRIKNLADRLPSTENELETLKKKATLFVPDLFRQSLKAYEKGGLEELWKDLSENDDSFISETNKFVHFYPQLIGRLQTILNNLAKELSLSPINPDYLIQSYPLIIPFKIPFTTNEQAFQLSFPSHSVFFAETSNDKASTAVSKTIDLTK